MCFYISFHSRAYGFCPGIKSLGQVHGIGIAFSIVCVRLHLRRIVVQVHIGTHLVPIANGGCSRNLHVVSQGDGQGKVLAALHGGEWLLLAVFSHLHVLQLEGVGAGNQ